MLFVLFLFTALVNLTFQQSDFIKDLSINVPFPPVIKRRDDIPTGHLRPLGWQNEPYDSLPEETMSLKPRRFWQEYVNSSRPLVLRSLIVGSSAMRNWNDHHLSRTYGHLDVEVLELKQQQSRDTVSKKMSFMQFLQGYRSQNWHLRVIMPEEMMQETPVPSVINCGPLAQDETKKSSGKASVPKTAQLSEAYLWMSAGETSSLLHSHPEHNFHCLIDGRKDFIFIPTEQFSEKTSPLKKDPAADWRSALDLYEKTPHSKEWYSKIDVDQVNAYKYSVLQETTWYWTTLRAGDCVFIPAHYLHQVRSYGRSVSTTVYFTRVQSEYALSDFMLSQLFAECDNVPLFSAMEAIAEHFVWTYTHGTRHLKRREWTTSDARLVLLYLLRTDKKLHEERFASFFGEITAELEVDESATTSKDLWHELVVSDTRKTLSAADIHKLSDKHLKNFITVLNKAANVHHKSRKHNEEL